jgi:hypothetical protein
LLRWQGSLTDETEGIEAFEFLGVFE